MGELAIPDFAALVTLFDQWLLKVIDWASSPQFYAQGGLVLLAILLAWALAGAIRRRSTLLREPPSPGPLLGLRQWVYQTRELLFPLLLILMLAIAADLSTLLVKQEWLVKLGQSVAAVFMLYTLLSQLIHHRLARNALRWVAIPMAVLYIFGGLDEVTGYLDSLSVEVGNIKFSAYGVARVLIFGSLLFWLGRLSSQAGQRLIRSQEDLDTGTREVFAKLFQVGLFVVVFVLLLQLMGINLTALAVFGGALGVGLGFGLQSIASNFISGVILLLERSMTVGDYIELEDGRGGTIRELNMRSTTLETFDGKDIMVPNETFVTTSFTNWTHKNKKQRYSLEFQVAYKTDLEQLFEVVREVVASHPSVLSGEAVPLEERPDAEIAGFGESGVDILVEFWMEGIDDGRNRVGADLLLMIWYALKEHQIQIPFPQREIRVVETGDVPGTSKPA